ncbi:hypothetical protein [Schlesneria sp. T3-172]|uniref:hypothetical protein n=1 Tax=Schlesneria sphaerica TaxID=3373610 RepID=UPI0037CB09EF
MKPKTIDIELTPSERKLLMRHGYPFEGIAKALQRVESSRNIELIPMSPFELEMLIGDVCRSINRMRIGRTMDQLMELCDRLEVAERLGHGMLDRI